MGNASTLKILPFSSLQPKDAMFAHTRFYHLSVDLRPEGSVYLLSFLLVISSSAKTFNKFSKNTWIIMIVELNE